MPARSRRAKVGLASLPLAAFTLAMVVAVIAATVLALSLRPPSAEACGFALPPPNYVTREVARAERLLDEGKLTAARDVTSGAKLILARQGRLADKHQLLRAMSIGGRVSVRLATTTTPGGELRPQPHQPKAAQLAQAVDELRAVVAQQPSPCALTDLAEGLAAVGSDAATSEARDMLESLAVRDLITSAHGWQALWLLRQAAGDDTATVAALRRCLQMRLPGSQLCTVAPAASKLL